MCSLYTIDLNTHELIINNLGSDSNSGQYGFNSGNNPNPSPNPGGGPQGPGWNPAYLTSHNTDENSNQDTREFGYRQGYGHSNLYEKEKFLGRQIDDEYLECDTRSIEDYTQYSTDLLKQEFKQYCGEFAGKRDESVNANTHMSNIYEDVHTQLHPGYRGVLSDKYYYAKQVASNIKDQQTKTRITYTHFARTRCNQATAYAIRSHAVNSRTYDAVCASNRREQYIEEMLITRRAQDRCLKDMEQSSIILKEIAKELHKRGITKF